jgi:serine/threonine protein phosphatase PrpC
VAETRVRPASATGAGVFFSSQGWPNDDRVSLAGRDFVAVADASGPTYGGWHRPIGVDASLAGAVAGWVERAADAPVAAMRAALSRANAAAYAPNWLDTSHDKRVHPTSSIAALGVRGGRAVVGHAGLCRGYRVRAGRIELVAVEHSITRERRRAGEPPLEEIVEQLFSTAPSRLFGFEETLEVELWEDEARERDLFILCTKGIWTQLDDGALLAGVDVDDLDVAAHRLVREATRDERAESATVVLCRVGG